MNKKKNKSSMSMGLNLTALMDIFTVLVFFLMVSSDGSSDNLAKSLSLPAINEGMHEYSDNNSSLMIIYHGGDVINVSDDTIAIDDFSEFMKGQNKYEKVELLADKRIAYSNIKTILDSIVNAGIPTVSLIVEKGDYD